MATINGAAGDDNLKGTVGDDIVNGGRGMTGWTMVILPVPPGPAMS
jgi:hypothetical protein